MKFETFESLINECKTLLDKSHIKDKALEKALGGDTTIITENIIIDNILKILAEELNDKTGSIDWLFWESINNTAINDENESYSFFKIDDVKYIGNPKNIWLDLHGKLGEKGV